MPRSRSFPRSRPLIDWLDYNGFTVVTKPLKEYTDAQGRRRVKGNMDIELAIDVMEMAERVDHVVIFSGDGDFRKLVEAVQRKGRRVSVCSTIRTQPPMVADELRRQADNFIELEELKPMIMREGRRAQQTVYAQNAARPRTPDAAGRRANVEPPADCPLCPRLFDVPACEPQGRIPDFFNDPVPSFGRWTRSF